ncbi:MAG: 1-(5-phosphoribosyl)-5-[(5-phosphoribosylamino)methylideneamino]imidazole-4-carboxamide isomerase [Solirubrobacterales bacterium]
MILYPAIDIRDGHAVRLVQGDYDRETIFDADPVDAALRWAEQGARALHVVDLDGAREGRPVNLDHIRRICAVVEVPVRVGGGLRSAEHVDEALEAGADRAILGTAAIAEPALVESLASRHGERIVAAADARAGRVAVEGWELEASITSAELIEALTKRGVRGFIYTPVEVDGTLGGPDIAGVREVCAAAGATGSELVYSGGVGKLDHLRELASLGLRALAGVIVGRALYEGRFTVAAGQSVLDERLA